MFTVLVLQMETQRLWPVTRSVNIGVLERIKLVLFCSQPDGVCGVCGFMAMNGLRDVTLIVFGRQWSCVVRRNMISG